MARTCSGSRTGSSPCWIVKVSFAIGLLQGLDERPPVVIAVEEGEHQAVEIAHLDVAEAEVRDPGVGFGLESGQGAGERAFAGLRRDPGGMEVELDEIRPEELQHQGREPVSIVPGVGERRGRSLPAAATGPRPTSASKDRARG